jgi:PAS domain S-box-containing protein
MTNDINEQKLLQEELVKSEERFRSLVEMAPDGIVTINLNGFITSGNQALFELTGYSEDELIGKHFTKLGTIRARDIPKYIKIFHSVILGKKCDPFEFMYIGKNGYRKWGQGRPKLIKVGGKRKEILLILRDVTQRKRDEEELRKILEDLERSNRELDDYTYAVSHDLKAPLRTIEAFSSFLLEDYAEKLDEEGKDYLKRMNEASLRMKNFIDDLLIISRVGRKFTEPEIVDLNNVIKEIKEEHEDILRERRANILSEKLPVLRTQKVWMKQLFSNLISNGLKFNKSAEPKVWVSFEERTYDYIFSIRDNGIGIDKKYHEQIFKIFQRLHTQDEYPGTGAGLTICQKIVEKLGGNINVESKQGKGSTFYFTYPKEEHASDISEVNIIADQDMIQVQDEI